MLQEYTGKVKTRCFTPATPHLFNTREEGDEVLLNDDNASKLHTIVAQALLLCKRARPDIKLSVAFLSTI